MVRGDQLSKRNDSATYKRSEFVRRSAIRNLLEHTVHKQGQDTIKFMADVYFEEAQNCLERL